MTNETSRKERDDIEAAIRSAFAGVRLGSGTSLQQARLFDEYTELSEAELAEVPRLETTDDWTQITDDELVCNALAHLDAEGLRYYLPPLMLWLLEHYNDEDLTLDGEASMTVIGTMSRLAPYAEFAKHHWEIYDEFTLEQRMAVARYVEAVPCLVELDYEDATRVSRAMERYWSQFLPKT
jgi:hypothetical protein